MEAGDGNDLDFSGDKDRSVNGEDNELRMKLCCLIDHVLKVIQNEKGNKLSTRFVRIE
jgi:hypothetical protein